MKTKLFSFISFLALALIPYKASASIEQDGLIYEIENGSAIVTSVVDKSIYTCGIKSFVEDGGTQYPVTSIGKNAFYNCDKLNTVTLPSSLVYIGEWAFFGCTALEQISLEHTSVTEIGKYAFSLCSNLTSIGLPKTLEIIGRSAFSSSGLIEITIPEAVTSIGNSAFSDCESLAEIKSNNSTFTAPNNCNALIKGNTLVVGCMNTKNIPNSVTVIGDNAFYGCSRLRVVDFLPNNITSIGEWAFFGCERLNRIILPEGLTVLGAYAFSLCSDLKQIDLPESLTNIGKSCFSSSGISSLVIKKNVKSIGESAFASCKNLNSIEVLDSDDSKYDSRENCNAIIQKSTNILVVGCNKSKIPTGVTEIGSNAFYGSQIETVDIPNTVSVVGEWAFFSCDKLTNVNLPNGLKYIDKYAFSMCSNLGKICFPATLLDIGTNAFSSSRNLMDVWAFMQNPIGIQEDAFETSVFNNAILHVPTGTISSYQNSIGWAKFVNMTEFEPSAIASPARALQRIYSDNGNLIVESAVAGNCTIYSVSGQIVRSLGLKKGTNTVSGLSKGVYIIYGTKVLVK